MKHPDEHFQALAKAYIQTQIRLSQVTIADRGEDIPGVMAVGDPTPEGFDLNISDESFGHLLTAAARVAGLDHYVHAEFKLPGDQDWRLLPESFIASIKEPKQ
jgi:hypothetical protein